MKRNRTDTVNGGRSAFLKNLADKDKKKTTLSNEKPETSKVIKNDVKHNAFAITLDVGATTAQNLCNGEKDETDLSQAKQLLDWLFSRKVLLLNNKKNF